MNGFIFFDQQFIKIPKAAHRHAIHELGRVLLCACGHYHYKRVDRRLVWVEVWWGVQCWGCGLLLGQLVCSCQHVVYVAHHVESHLRDVVHLSCTTKTRESVMSLKQCRCHPITPPLLIPTIYDPLEATNCVLEEGNVTSDSLSVIIPFTSSETSFPSLPVKTSATWKG